MLGLSWLIHKPFFQWPFLARKTERAKENRTCERKWKSRSKGTHTPKTQKFSCFFFLLSDPRLMQRSSSENHEKNSNKATLNIKPGSSCANSEFCPSCSEPFDNGKKRRLIDSCGHERCYTCMFSKELCSLCTFQGKISGSCDWSAKKRILAFIQFARHSKLLSSYSFVFSIWKYSSMFNMPCQ